MFKINFSNAARHQNKIRYTTQHYLLQIPFVLYPVITQWLWGGYPGTGVWRNEKANIGTSTGPRLLSQIQSLYVGLDGMATSGTIWTLFVSFMEISAADFVGRPLCLPNTYYLNAYHWAITFRVPSRTIVRFLVALWVPRAIVAPF